VLDDQTRNLAERLSRCPRQRPGLGAFKKTLKGISRTFTPLI
jgi:hypothetical protein